MSKKQKNWMLSQKTTFSNSNSIVTQIARFNHTKFITTLALTLILSACGGGEEKNETNNTPEPITQPTMPLPMPNVDPPPSKLNTTKSGQWVSSSGRVPLGSDNMTYSFRVLEAGSVDINLNSNDADTYLFILDNNSEVIAENDDFIKSDSFLNLSLPIGQYSIVAATYYKNVTGTFEISITSADLNAQQVEFEAVTAFPAPNENIQTGRFLAGAVHGMLYTTESQTGVTNENGEFTYLQGETVSFYLGDYKLPEIAAQPIITPIEYSPGSSNSGQLEVNNLVRLFHSLDTNLDSSDGIQLPSSLHSKIETSSTEPLNFSLNEAFFERFEPVLDLISKNSLTSLTSSEEATIAFQIVLDGILNDLLEAASADSSSSMRECVDARNGYVSPYPCIPGSGGIAIGPLSVKTVYSPNPFLPVNGNQRTDTIFGGNSYYTNLHRLSSVFDTKYYIRDFADDLNKGIVLFTSTDTNPDRKDVIAGSGFNHTELFLDDKYIGNLPYTSEVNLREVKNRCGLPTSRPIEANTRRLVLEPGAYKFNANAYESYGCRSGTFCPSANGAENINIGDVIIANQGNLQLIDNDLVQAGQIPIWEWDGEFEVAAGECIVINSNGQAYAPETVEQGSVIFHEADYWEESIDNTWTRIDYCSEFSISDTNIINAFRTYSFIEEGSCPQEYVTRQFLCEYDDYSAFAEPVPVKYYLPSDYPYAAQDCQHLRLESGPFPEPETLYGVYYRQDDIRPLETCYEETINNQTSLPILEEWWRYYGAATGEKTLGRCEAYQYRCVNYDNYGILTTEFANTSTPEYFKSRCEGYGGEFFAGD